MKSRLSSLFQNTSFDNFMIAKIKFKIVVSGQGGEKKTVYLFFFFFLARYLYMFFIASLRKNQ